MSDNMDRRYDHDQSEAYQQGRRDGLIEGLEKQMGEIKIKVDDNHSKNHLRFMEVEKRQTIAERLIYILAATVALSEGSAVAKLLLAG